MCDDMDNENPTEIRILNYSHSTVTFRYKGQQNEVLVAMKPKHDDWDIIWMQKQRLGYYTKHLIRNDSKWLVYMYNDNGVSHFESFNLEREGRRYSFHRHMDLGNMGYDACCEIHEDLLYYIQRKVRFVPELGSFVVSYHGKIFIIDEDQEDAYFDIEIPQAYVVAGNVKIAQISFRAGTLLDMIGVQVGCRDKDMQWSCFAQKLDTAPLGPAHLLYTGPMCCERCLQQCKSSVQTSIIRRCRTKVVNSHFRRFSPPSGKKRRYI